MSAVLQFIANDADEDEGLSNAGIETFRDAPFAGIARECGQNSLDASVQKPVTLRFDLLRLPADEFPALAQYRATMEACRKRSQERRKQDEFLFFSNAVKVLKQPEIRVLCISDEGTSGLAGPCVQGTPFHALVKSAGVSQKDLPTAGGSFGIGKHAAYAVSDLRTVFYSTIYNAPDGSEQFLAQGKSILVSHIDVNGTPRKASGYWGGAGYQPISLPSDVPAWLRRTKRGTSIFAAGFPDSEDWALRVAESLLRNFFVAIHRHQIQFSIDDEAIKIDSESLASLFNNDQIQRAAEDNFTLDDFTNSRHLYGCLVDNNTKLFDTHIGDIGKIQMYLAVEDHLPKRVFIVRNGMMITDNLQYFNDKLIRFPMFRDFIAIVEPADDKASELIKRLEDPKHRDLSAERLIDRSEQAHVKAAMRSLIAWIRERIRAESFEEPEDEVEVDEMSEFFADVSTDPPVADPQAPDTDPEKFVYRPTPLGKKGNAQDTSGALGGGGGTRRAKRKAKKKDGEGRGRGAGGRGNRGYSERIRYYEFRNVANPRLGRSSRTLYFTPDTSGVARLVIEAAGINTNEALRITKVNEQSLSETQEAIVDLKEEERMSLAVEFEQQFEGPIELILLDASERNEVPK